MVTRQPSWDVDVSHVSFRRAGVASVYVDLDESPQAVHAWPGKPWGPPHQAAVTAPMLCFPNVPRCCHPRPATSRPCGHAEHEKSPQTPCPPPQLFTAAATRHAWHASQLRKSRYNRVNRNTEIRMFHAGCPDFASSPAGTHGPWGARVPELTAPGCEDPALLQGLPTRTSAEASMTHGALAIRPRAGQVRGPSTHQLRHPTGMVGGTTFSLILRVREFTLSSRHHVRLPDTETRLQVGLWPFHEHFAHSHTPLGARPCPRVPC